MCKGNLTLERLTNKPLNKNGFKYHLKYGYPAFASVEKYKDSCTDILKYINGKSEGGALNLIVFCAKNCPYLIQYVKMPFNEEDVETYWKGKSKNSHNSIKFRDWIIDDVLELEEREIELSKKCNISELNNCLILPAKIEEIKKNKIKVSYLEYNLEKNKLSLKEKIDEISAEFLKEFEVGDYVSKHHNYAIEKIKIEEKEGLISHQRKLIKSYNENKEKLKNLIPLSDKIIDSLK